MLRVLYVGLAVAFCFEMLAMPAQAGPLSGAAGGGVAPAVDGPPFTFDESGNQTGNLTPIIGPDPTGGRSGNVLIYVLPASFGTVGSGDVRIFEPNGTTLSDILRFTDAQGNFFNFSNNSIFDDADRFVFYSADNGGLPADGGLPANMQPVFFDGGGAQEDANGVFNFIGDYIGTSPDAVIPEPATLALCALGLGLVGWRRWAGRRS
jgi:hypothetical protein